MKRCEAQFQRIHSSMRTFWKNQQKSWDRPEDQEVCCEVLSSTNVQSYIYKVSPTWLPKRVLNKDNSNRHACQSKWQKAHEASVLYKELSAIKKCWEQGRWSSLEKESTNWISNIKCSALKSCVYINDIFKNIYVSTYLHIITISVKGGYDFEREQGGYMWRLEEENGKEKCQKFLKNIKSDTQFEELPQLTTCAYFESFLLTYYLHC